MSDYIYLMELRKQALFDGDEKLAERYQQEIEILMESGYVTEDELIAAAYI